MPPKPPRGALDVSTGKRTPEDMALIEKRLAQAQAFSKPDITTAKEDKNTQNSINAARVSNIDNALEVTLKNYAHAYLCTSEWGFSVFHRHV